MPTLKLYLLERAIGFFYFILFFILLILGAILESANGSIAENEDILRKLKSEKFFEGGDREY